MVQHQIFFTLFTVIEHESHGMFGSTPSSTFWYHVSWFTEVKKHQSSNKLQHLMSEWQAFLYTVTELKFGQKSLTILRKFEWP